MRTLTFMLVLLFTDPLSARTYTTSFPATEAPISEGGNWINGHVTGLDWADVYTTAGTRAYDGTQVGNETCPSNCNDATAIVSGSWGADQTCTAVVSIPSPISTIVEVECRLRTTIVAHSITGYEVNCSVGNNNYAQIIRWNGALGAFTQLFSSGAARCNNGDTLQASIVGSLITLKINGSIIGTFSDATYTTGSPGIGFFCNTGTCSASLSPTFGFSSIILTDGINSSSSAPATAIFSLLETEMSKPFEITYSPALLLPAKERRILWYLNRVVLSK